MNTSKNGNRKGRRNLATEREEEISLKLTVKWAVEVGFGYFMSSIVKTKGQVQLQNLFECLSQLLKMGEGTAHTH